MGRHASTRTVQEKLEQRRLRCKLNQRRYRANLRVTNAQRRADMDELDRVNQRLDRHIDTIERTGLWCHAEELSVIEYFRLFEYGYTGTQRQDSFLRYFVEPNGWCNGNRGVDAVTLVWTSYGTSFSSVHIKHVKVTHSSHAQDGAMVNIECVAELGMSTQAIQAMFPRVLSRQDLVDKMLCTPFVLPLHASFVFDDNKQTTWITTTANVVHALFYQFGNLNDVVVAATNTAIQPDAMIRRIRDSCRRN
ncbi:hypothetical protein H310_05331 [Aphanomyces invadans]|nr:hypothetical protein H310_05331 [Aphanomyces invadans]ETW02854.1 hypothetical protein H310_05331 [Aphanomyces invadans]|eukprot:XP_008868238.1 hypothetical protein H310_05331 [Aphanomyces invadans]